MITGGVTAIFQAVLHWIIHSEKEKKLFPSVIPIVGTYFVDLVPVRQRRCLILHEHAPKGLQSVIVINANGIFTDLLGSFNSFWRTFCDISFLPIKSDDHLVEWVFSGAKGKKCSPLSFKLQIMMMATWHLISKILGGMYFAIYLPIVLFVTGASDM